MSDQQNNVLTHNDSINAFCREMPLSSVNKIHVSHKIYYTYNNNYNNKAKAI